MDNKAFYEQCITYLAEQLQISEAEIRQVMKPDWKMSTPADIKSGLEYATGSNMLLSAMKAATKGHTKTVQQDEEQEIRNVIDILNKYTRELEAGAFPLGDKDIIEKEYVEYGAMMVNPTNWAAKDKPTWALFQKRGITATNLPKYTTLNLSTITNEFVDESSTPRTISDVSKRVAKRRMAERQSAMEVRNDVLNSMLEGIWKTINALGSAAQVVSAELYGINRAEAMDRRSK